MKRQRIANKYTYSFGIVSILCLASTCLWILSGVSPIVIADQNGTLSKLADIFGGMSFLASISWLLGTISIVSGVILSIMFLMYIYNTFCTSRASKALDNLLKMIPSHLDEDSLETMAEHGISITDHQLTISAEHWQLASAKASAHTIAHLLYLYSRDNLDILLSGEHTVFHQLARMLIEHADDVSIKQFVAVVKKRKAFLGNLLKAAIDRILREDERDEIDAEIATIKICEQEALAVARKDLAAQRAKVNRTSPNKKSILAEVANIDAEAEILGGSKSDTSMEMPDTIQTEVRDEELQTSVPFVSAFEDGSEELPATSEKLLFVNH